MSALGYFTSTLFRFSSFSPSLSDCISGDISARRFFLRMMGVGVSVPTLISSDCAVISFWAFVKPNYCFTASICSVSSRIMAPLNWI